MNVMSLMRFALSASLIAALPACGAKSVDLQKPPQSAAPTVPPSRKPSPDNPSAPNPEKPERPTPAPGETVEARYRLVCEVGSGPGRTTFLSTDANSRSFDPFADLYLGSFADPNQKVTRANYNIVEAYSPIAIDSSTLDRLDLLFIGKKLGLTDVRLFQVAADTNLRIGQAVDLGPAVQVDRGARSAAEAMGLSAANYGASDSGKLILLPSSGGFKVMSRDRTKTYGMISASVSTTILPRINEAKRIYTALVYNGRGFSPVVAQLALTPSSVSVSRSFALGFSSATSSTVQSFGANSVAWLESTSVGGGSRAATSRALSTVGRRAELAFSRKPRSLRLTEIP
jgi:hypothetical protein